MGLSDFILTQTNSLLAERDRTDPAMKFDAYFPEDPNITRDTLRIRTSDIHTAETAHSRKTGGLRSC